MYRRKHGSSPEMNTRSGTFSSNKIAHVVQKKQKLEEDVNMKLSQENIKVWFLYLSQWKLSIDHAGRNCARAERVAGLCRKE